MNARADMLGEASLPAALEEVEETIRHWSGCARMGSCCQRLELIS